MTVDSTVRTIGSYRTYVRIVHGSSTSVRTTRLSFKAKGEQARVVALHHRSFTRGEPALALHLPGKWEQLPARAEVVRVEMDDRQVERLAKGARQAGLAAPPAPMTAIRFKAAAGPDELAPR